jgi:hypothetical protein
LLLCGITAEGVNRQTAQDVFRDKYAPSAHTPLKIEETLRDELVQTQGQAA